MAETQETAIFAVRITSLDPSEEATNADDLKEAIVESYTDDGYLVEVYRTGVWGPFTPDAGER